MNATTQTGLGKKIFFLYPPGVVKNELHTRLLEQEYETYLLNDHSAAKKILRAHPDSIVFVNIEDGMSEGDWRNWIRSLSDDPQTKDVGVGVLSMNQDDALARIYQTELGVSCGFIRLKYGSDSILHSIVETLKARDVNGRRRYIRADCRNDQFAKINVRYDGQTTNGHLRDISVVGFSCVLDPEPHFKKNAKLSDIQLKLRGWILNTEGIVFGFREDEGQTVYVVLFTNRLDDIGRDKIRGYMKTALQSEIDLQARTQ